MQCVVCQHGLVVRTGGKGIDRIENRDLRRAAELAHNHTVGRKSCGDGGAAARGRGHQRDLMTARPPARDLPRKRIFEISDGNRRLSAKPATRRSIIRAQSENYQIGLGQVTTSPAFLAACRGFATDAVAFYCHFAGKPLLQHRTKRLAPALRPASRNMTVADDGNGGSRIRADKCLGQIGDG